MVPCGWVEAEVLADCRMALGPADRAAGDRANRLERKMQKGRLAASGVFGRRLFPDALQVARDLVRQLREREAFEALRTGNAPSGHPQALAGLLEAWLDAALAWDRQHGWSAYWLKLGTAWDLLPSWDPGFPEVISRLRKETGGGSPPAVDALLDPIGLRLSRTFDSRVVAQCAIGPLKRALLDPGRAAR